MITDHGAVLGIDVGFSERRKTSCLCLLQWSSGIVEIDFEKVSIREEHRISAIRRLVPEGSTLECVAIDGPLTHGLRNVVHYRAAEALLSRGQFQKRGKPGQTSSPTGQKLHQHALMFAHLLLNEVESGRFSLTASTHMEPIHRLAIVEAFPNLFLGSLLNERDLPSLNRDASDKYWKEAIERGILDRLLATFLPGHRFQRELRSVRDHEERAGVVCSLTALGVASGGAVAVGDPEDGDIFLPPADSWGKSSSDSTAWVESTLRTNIIGVRREFASARVWLAAAGRPP